MRLQNKNYFKIKKNFNRKYKTRDNKAILMLSAIDNNLYKGIKRSSIIVSSILTSQCAAYQGSGGTRGQAGTTSMQCINSISICLPQQPAGGGGQGRGEGVGEGALGVTDVGCN